jgi:HSP20 family protein
MANMIRRENREAARGRGQEYNVEPFRSWDPFRVMDALLRLDPFQGGGFGGLMGRGRDAGFMPQFDVKETKDGYLFRADLPGVDEGDLDISVTGNLLTVSGHREEERREENEQYYAMERSYGHFSRSFSLPDGADPENVKAELKDGVLTLHLPKKPEVQPRKISLGKGGGEKSAKA